MSSTSLALSSSVPSDRRARLSAAARPRLALMAGLVMFALTGGGLVLAHRPTPSALPRSVALQAALADPATAGVLRSLQWERFDVTPLDRQHEVLGFYRGGRMVAAVTIGRAGNQLSLSITDLARMKFAFGSNIANDVRTLGLLGLVFVLMTAVWPLWRMRNLDVLVIVSLTLSVILYNQGRLVQMVLVTYPALGYLALRCAWWALGPGRSPAPAVPLFDQLTRRWKPGEQLRVLRLVALATALITATVGLTSLHVLDVGYAVMEGATAVLHGMLPYGHIPDVLHGDTYPLASYLLYVPFAWLWPVRSVWDNADATLGVAVLAALLAAGGIWRLSVPDRRAGAATPPDVARRRWRAAIGVLAFPPLLVTVSSGTTDVALAAMLIAVLLLWRRPGWGMAALSLAAWFKAAPVALVPLLLGSLRGRAMWRAVAVLVLTSGVMLGILVGLGGLGGPERMLSAIAYQFTRNSPHTLWALVGSVPFQQLCEAATVALIVGAALRLRQDRGLAHDSRRVAALVAAVLLGIQLSANYWSFLYLVWTVPIVLIPLFAEQHRGAERSPSVQLGQDPLTPSPQPPIPA